MTNSQISFANSSFKLKFLYVAITRARKNLWIVDCSEKCEPMRVRGPTDEPGFSSHVAIDLLDG